MAKRRFGILNWGISPDLTTSLQHRIISSNQIALTLFVMSLILEGFFLIIHPVNIESIAIIIAGLFALSTLLFNKFGLIFFSRYWLSSSLPILIIITSIYSKLDNNHPVHEYDYFNYRIMILAISIVPAIVFNLEEVRSLLFCFLLSALIIIFFDPIHVLFDVGNKYAADVDSHYYFSNVVIVLSYGLILGLIIFLKSAAEKNEIKNEKLVAESDLSKQRLIKYQYALLSAAKEYRNLEGNEMELYKLICSTLSINLGVNRVSVWELSGKQTLIRKYLFEEDGGTDEQVCLEQIDFPNYFYAFQNKPFISADNARTNKDTKEFTDSYLLPLNIYSMLDCPIIFRDKTIGVICCENQHTSKLWNPEDAIFVQSLADLISMFKQSEEIEHLLYTVRQKNEELANQTNEIKTINENLESIVKKRTLDLEQRNQKLVEYGFINSHLVRAPLARILGLSDLISREIDLADSDLVELLLNSSHELDTILSRITNVLSSDQHLSIELMNKEISRAKAPDTDD